MKKIITYVLVVAMVCMMLPVNAFAATLNATFTAKGADWGRLTDAEGMEYSVDGGDTWKSVTSSLFIIKGVNENADIKVRADENALDNEIQIIDITKAEKPNVSYKHPTDIAASNGTIDMDTEKHEYKGGLFDTDNWSREKPTGLGPGKYEVRVQASDTMLASESQVIMLAVQTEKPNISIDYVAEKLTGFSGGKRYQVSVQGEISLSTTVQGKEKIQINSKWYGKTIEIVGMIGDAVSESQLLDIPAKPAAPTDLIGIPCTGSGESDGQIMGTTPGMEYCIEGGTWQQATDQAITELDKGTYEVRVRASNYKNTFVGASTTITVGVAEATAPEEKPTAEIDYVKETLKGLVRNATYTIANDAYSTQITVGATGTWAIADQCFGTTITIVRNNEDSNSEAQELPVPEKPAAPEGLASGNDMQNFAYKITGTKAGMEYRASLEDSWTPVTDTQITGLDKGTYEVRVAASDEKQTFASAIKVLTIGNKTGQETTPTAEIDYETEMLTGLKQRSDYTITAGATTSKYEMGYEGTVLNIEPSWYGKTISIVKLPSGLSVGSNSAPQELPIPIKPVAPSVIAVDCTASDASDGKITNVDETMEYRLSSAESWTDVTGTEITGLDKGTYEVRVKASNENETFVGASARVNIGVTIVQVPAVGFQTRGEDCGDLQDVTSGMYYSIDGGVNWIEITDATIEDEDGVDIAKIPSGVTTTHGVLVKANEGVEVFQTITITKEPKPNASYDFATGELTNLKPNERYKLTNSEHMMSTPSNDEGKISLWSAWYGREIQLVDQGVDCILDSEPQIFTLPEQATTPTGLTGIPCTEGGNDGVIMGVDTTMEYRLSSAESWIDVTGTEITGLAKGFYLVRVKATDSAFASSVAYVRILEADEATPTANIDYVNEKLISLAHLQSGYAYQVAIENGSFTGVIVDLNDEMAVDPSWFGKTIKIAIVNSGRNEIVSIPQSLEIPVRPGVPTGLTGVACTAIGTNDGKITGTTTAMEYRLSSAESWTPVTDTEITGIAEGTYEVRVKASNENGTFVGTSTTIIIDPPTEYKVIEGDNQELTVGDSDTVSFRIDHEYTENFKLYLDGELVSRGNYTVKEGSTIITLNSDYVKTLTKTVSEHEFTVKFEDGYTVLNLVVKPFELIPMGPSTTTTPTVTISPTPTKDTHINPQTGV